MKKLTLTLAALAMLSGSAFAADNTDCVKLTANYKGAPEFQCANASGGNGQPVFSQREQAIKDCIKDHIESK